MRFLTRDSSAVADESVPPDHESGLTVSTQSRTRTDDSNSEGFSLIELLVVVALLGVLAAITVFTVRGTAQSGEERACDADGRTVEQAADLYLAQNQVATIPATGTGPNQFEQTLVDAELLKTTSTFFDLAADGTVTSSGEPCP